MRHCVAVSVAVACRLQGVRAARWREAAKNLPWREAVAPYRLLDNLAPQAPFDSTGDPVEVSSVAGNWEAAQIIPAYQNPDHLWICCIFKWDLPTRQFPHYHPKTIHI